MDNLIPEEMEQTEEAPSPSKNQIAIRNFVIRNPGRTENFIAKQMDKNRICSRLTTRKELASLVSSHILEHRKEGNGFHCFYVNDKSIFNKIYQELSEIEAIINSMTEPILKIFNLKVRAKTKEEVRDIHNLQMNFQYSYKIIADIMVQDLLLLTRTKKISTIDSQLLYTIIIKCMLKLTRQSHFLKSSKDYLEQVSNDLIDFRKSPEIQTYVKKGLVNIDVLDKFIMKIESFKKEFLPLHHLLM